MNRETLIKKSIIDAVHDSPKRNENWIFQIIQSFFCLYQLALVKCGAQLFKGLRKETWLMNEDQYQESFDGVDSLQSLGDMGYSGSTFFTTSNSHYLVKSIPRRFEHTFFRDDMLKPYIVHMTKHPHSLLVHILDFLQSPQVSIGSLLSFAPSHHIIMDNLLVGKGEKKWGTWDLKPESYFYPERDIAGGMLTPDSVKDKLIDRFNDKIHLNQNQADEFWSYVEEDTALLAECNAVDYSLFLVRIPLPDGGLQLDQPESWRTGVRSADGKYVFRAIILDFFWAKHKVHAQAMTMLIDAWNLLDRQAGPMSITTTPEEYRTRFQQMCKEMVEVRE